jgi:gamma-glutamyltranspeptidase / glutathione hydrolase
VVNPSLVIESDNENFTESNEARWPLRGLRSSSVWGQAWVSKAADEGVTISERTATFIKTEFASFPEYPKSIFGEHGEPLRAGERLVQKDLARSLRLIAKDGAKVVHGGELGIAIDSTVGEAGGFLTIDDLRNNRAEWWKPIDIDYRGCKVIAAPAPTNAWNGLLRLGIMSRFDVPSLGHNSAAYLHRCAEVTKLAYGARHRYAGDPDINPPPLDELLAEKSGPMRQRRSILVH